MVYRIGHRSNHGSFGAYIEAAGRAGGGVEDIHVAAGRDAHLEELANACTLNGIAESLVANSKTPLRTDSK